MNGAATNPNFDVLSYWTQVKNALDATIALGVKIMFFGVGGRILFVN